MQKKLTTLALSFPLVFAAQSTLAKDNGWYEAAYSADGKETYSMKFGSGERTQNKQGEAMTMVVGKQYNKKTNKIVLQKWYVTDTDCAQEYGNLVVLTIDGKYLYDAPFAIGSETISSFIAKTICLVTANEQEKANGKGT